MTGAESAASPLVLALPATGSGGATVTATGTATASPSPAPSPDPTLVTPGALGFVVVFLLALVTWLLLRNMTRRLRRMRLREEEAARRGETLGTPDADPPPRPGQPPSAPPADGS